MAAVEVEWGGGWTHGQRLGSLRVPCGARRGEYLRGARVRVKPHPRAPYL